MGAARQLFLEVRSILEPGDKAAYAKLRRAAALWRNEGQHFSAGFAMLRAMDAAWGRPDRMLEAQSAALQDFDRVISDEPPDSPVALAALHKSRQTHARASHLFEGDRAVTQGLIRELSSEIAQRLLTYFGDSKQADSYLIRGFIVTTDLDGTWDVQFPAHEPDVDSEQWAKISF